MEAVRAADGSWRVNGEPADVEGLQAARARVAALESELRANGEVTEAATVRESEALQKAEGLEAQARALTQELDTERNQLEAVTLERDTARMDLAAARTDLAAARLDLAGARELIDRLNQPKEDPDES